ncbi:DUF6320 domain-containing protein [Negadavirga shengliensis]|uniref:DUF6320 domain-containing protein n=1 Tax=Negadavirga shengliensis TaxID=1389218 RepID=A0ABV9SWH8_9BACT
MLEPDMKVCPLCETPLGVGRAADKDVSDNERDHFSRRARFDDRRMSSPQRKATWELVSIILILLVITTSLINYIINREISWSEYPVAVFLIIFSYVSSFAFLDKKREIQVFCAFLTASLAIFMLDSFTGGKSWAIHLGIPLLFFSNMVFIGVLVVFRNAIQRGINLIAYSFFATALLCLCVEASTDLYITGRINLFWSLIVSACVLPVAAVLLFMHHRMKKGRDLNRIFHV